MGKCDFDIVGINHMTFLIIDMSKNEESFNEFKSHLC